MTSETDTGGGGQCQANRCYVPRKAMIDLEHASIISTLRSTCWNPQALTSFSCRASSVEPASAVRWSHPKFKKHKFL